MRLVDAQQARRVLDRLVGYTLSPLLWRKLSRKWLSAGRVQSVTVRLIVEREKEIRIFLKGTYFTIDGVFIPPSSNGEELSAVLLKRMECPTKKARHLHFDGTYTSKTSSIQTENQANTIISDIASPFAVSAVEKKKFVDLLRRLLRRVRFSRIAAESFRFRPKKTMQIAQKLYEEGYITYHRTDSVNLSEKFLTEARGYIEKHTERPIFRIKTHVSDKIKKSLRKRMRRSAQPPLV